MRVEETIDRAASVVPGKIALRYGARAWTYAELRAERDRRAGVLVEAGLRAGDRLVVAERVTDEQVITYLACARAGGVYVGLSALLTDTELAALTGRLAPRFALTTNGLPHPGLPAAGMLPLPLPGEPAAAALVEAARRSAAGTTDDPCEIRTTSGTTGQRPKLILNAHRTIGWRCSAEPWTVAQERVHCALTATAIQMGAICRVFARGGTAALPWTIGVYGLEEELAGYGTTHVATTPALLGALVGQGQPPPANLRLRLIQTGGAALTDEIRRAATDRYGATIVQRYGMSECPGIMAMPESGAPPGSVGQPNEGMEVRIVDESGQPVPGGEVGELIVRSPMMMLGYFDDPEATAETLRDGWLYTGDNARCDAEGFYFLVGRRGLQINVGGHKVSPEEVEAVLERHPGVREVVVVPHPDRSRGEVVKAIVVPEGDAPDAQALRRFCRAQLAGYKVPRAIEYRREPLPRSARGKVLRQQV